VLLRRLRGIRIEAGTAEIIPTQEGKLGAKHDSRNLCPKKNYTIFAALSVKNPPSIM
jgi:hypothetical protein